MASSSLMSMSTELHSILSSVMESEEQEKLATDRVEAVKRAIERVLVTEHESLYKSVVRQIPRSSHLLSSCDDLSELEQFVILSVLYLMLDVTINRSRAVYNRLMELKLEEQQMFKDLFEVILDDENSNEDREPVGVQAFFAIIEGWEKKTNETINSCSATPSTTASNTPGTPKSLVYTTSIKKARMERSCSLKQLLDSPVTRRLSRYQVQVDEQRMLAAEFREELDEERNEKHLLKVELERSKSCTEQMQNTIDALRKQLSSNDSTDSKLMALEQEVEMLKANLRKETKEKDRLLKDNNTRQVWENCASLEKQLRHERERVVALEVIDKDKSAAMARLDSALRRNEEAGQALTSLLDEKQKEIEDYKQLVASLKTATSHDDSGVIRGVSLSDETAADIVVADQKLQLEEQNKQLSMYKDQTHHLEKDLRCLKERLGTADERYENITSEMDTLRAELVSEKDNCHNLIASLREELSDRDVMIISLNEEVEKLRGQGKLDKAKFDVRSQEMEGENIMLREEISKLNLELVNLNTSSSKIVDQLKYKNEVLNQGLSALEVDNSSLHERLAELKDKFAKELTENKEKVQITSTTIQNLQMTNDSLQNQIVEMRRADEVQEQVFHFKVEEMTKERSELEQKLSEALEQVKMSREETESAKRSCEEKIACLEEQLNEVSRDNKSAINSRMILEQKVDELKQEAVENELQHKKILNNLEDENRAKLQNSSTQFSIERKALEDQVFNLKEEKAVLEVRERALLQQISGYEVASVDCHSRFEKEKADLQAKCQDARDLNDILKASVKEYEEKVRCLEREEKELKNVKVQLELQLSEVSNTLAIERQEFTSSKTELENNKRDMEEQLGKLKRSECERSKLNQEFDVANASLKEITQEKALVDKSLDEYKVKISELKSELVTKERMIAECQESLKESKNTCEIKLAEIESLRLLLGDTKKEKEEQVLELKEKFDRELTVFKSQLESRSNDAKEKVEDLESTKNALQSRLDEALSELSSKTDILLSTQKDSECTRAELVEVKSMFDEASLKLKCAEVDLEKRESMLARAEDLSKHHNEERAKLQTEHSAREQELKAEYESKLAKLDEAMKNDYDRKLEEMNEKFNNNQTLVEARLFKMEKELREKEMKSAAAYEGVMQKYDASKKIIEKFQNENKSLKAEKKQFSRQLIDATQQQENLKKQLIDATEQQRKMITLLNKPPVIEVSGEENGSVGKKNEFGGSNKDGLNLMEKSSVAFEVPLDDFDFKQPDVHTPGRSRPGRTRSTLNLRRGPPVGTGALFATEEEEGQFLSFAPLSSDTRSNDRLSLGGYSADGRISELARRNTLVPAHLKSSYPVETQFYHPDSFADDNLRTGAIGSIGNMAIIDNTVERDRKRTASSADRNSSRFDSRRNSLRINSGNEDDSVFHPIQASSYSRPGPPTPAASAKRSKTTTTTVLLSSTTTTTKNASALNTSHASNASSVGDTELSGLSDMTNLSNHRSRVFRSKVINSPKVLTKAVTRMFDGRTNKYSVLEEEKMAAKAQRQRRQQQLDNLKP